MDLNIDLLKDPYNYMDNFKKKERAPELELQKQRLQKQYDAIYSVCRILRYTVGFFCIFGTLTTLQNWLKKNNINLLVIYKFNLNSI